MTKNKKNFLKWILAAIATFGIPYFLSQDPIKFIDVIGIIACLVIWGWFFWHVVHDE